MGSLGSGGGLLGVEGLFFFDGAAPGVEEVGLGGCVVGVWVYVSGSAVFDP